MSTSGPIEGRLQAGIWTRVMSAWGTYLSLNYGVSTGAPGGQYRCYAAPDPFPISSGSLPCASVTFTVIGYGDMWLFSPFNTTYAAVPVSH
jgi:hypothetical protein